MTAPFVKRLRCFLFGHRWSRKRYRMGIMDWVAEDAPVLRAAGGWCAPAGTTYDLMGPTWHRLCRRCDETKAADS